MRILIGLIAAALLTPSTPAATQATDAEKPSLDAKIDKIVERLEAMAEELHIPGMGLALVTPEGSFTRGIGVREIDGEPLTADTYLEIGSTTKTFTGVLAAALVEAEVNIHYLYPFIMRPNGKCAIAMNVEDNDFAASVLHARQIRCLNRGDIAR